MSRVRRPLPHPLAIGLRLATVPVLVMTVLLAGCTASVPRNIDNCCSIFKERRSWYRDSRKAEKRWGVPVHVQLAIIHQESRFVAKARPPRTKFLWIFPGPRPSNSYGYTQALTETWENYMRDTGNRGADRDEFGDSVDFVGWYAARSARVNRLSKWDAYNLYLAYHEGDGGYRRGTYRNKTWLIRVAGKVRDRAGRYSAQLAGCKEDLEPRWWQFWL